MKREEVPIEVEGVARFRSVGTQLLLYAPKCRSAEELCAMAASRMLSQSIPIIPLSELPKDVPGVTIKLSGQFFILYKPTYYREIQLSILHELSHICLGHLDGIDVDLSAVLEGKTIFTDEQEQEAELLAHQLMGVIALQNEENSDSIYSVRLTEENPFVWERPQLGGQQIALRFQAFIP
jgi:hypothetical protein